MLVTRAFPKQKKNLAKTFEPYNDSNKFVLISNRGLTLIYAKQLKKIPTFSLYLIFNCYGT